MDPIRDFFERELPARLTSDFEETVQITVTGKGGGIWCVSGSGVKKGRCESQCELELSAETFTAIAGGLDPKTAFLSGQLKINGYLDVALKIARLLTR